MTLKNLRQFSAFVITLVIMGVFANVQPAQASFSDILGSFGIGSGNTYGSSYSTGYDYNSTSGQNQGDIRISKQARQVGRDSYYNETLTVRSGSLVEVIIQIQNTSSKYPANTVVTDELGGSVVYAKNSLLVNGQAGQSGLTSGGLNVVIPSKTTATITYQIYVCGGSNYIARASAYAPGIGSATDGIVLNTENSNITYYNNDVSTCLNQLQMSQSTNNSGVTNYASYNPFGDWTGVNNLTSTTQTQTTTSTSNVSTNPFGDWVGVNNASGTTATANNPFGDWTGVNNSESTSNPFGDWVGSSAPVNNSDPFGTWTGVNNSQSTGNPFGDWTGVNNSDAQFNASGYSTNNPTVAYTPNSGSTDATYTAPATTNYVAPTTGVNTTAPFVFAGLLTAGFLIIRKRKWLFN